MSRSNAKTARVLREEESMALRKRILKTGVNQTYSKENADLFETLADSNNAYEERLSKLKSFKKQSKVNTKVQSHKSEWIREQGLLCTSVHKHESEIDRLMEVILMHDPSDDLIISELLEVHSIYRNDRLENQKMVLSQWQELKEMLNESLKSIKKSGTLPVKHNINKSIVDNNSKTLLKSENFEKNNKNNKVEKEEERVFPSSSRFSSSVPSAWIPALSIFADVLLQVRSSHHNSWNNLKSMEVELVDDALFDRYLIAAMLRDDRLEEQNENLKSIFLMQEEDNIDVEMFMEDWFQKIHELDTSHNKSITELHNERNQICVKLNVDSSDRNGGWIENEHDLFSKIYRRAQNDGMPRKLLSSLLATNLPHRSQESLNAHEEWFRQVKALSNRKKDVIADYTKKRDDIIEAAKEQLHVFRESRRESLVQDARLAEHEKSRSLLHIKLDELRFAKNAIQAEIALEDQKVRQLELGKMTALADMVKQEHDMKRQKAEEYKKMKIELADERRRREEELLAQEKEIVKENIEKNRAQVELRNAQIREREEERKRKEAEQAAEEALRLEKLMKLAEQVPYWENIQNAHSKLDHITASVQGHQYLKGEDLSRGFIPMFGFTDQTIIKDSRFRLITALRSAGVIQSDAARHAIAQFNPRPQLAIHGLL